ncbi:MAG: glycogen debranching enzyme N-terminal domain-containing protein [Planctomycetes bacterium]|nr:glycogen debranching enzyme N-terminal domain-containing protein [Planctomycetota bacterium]
MPVPHMSPAPGERILRFVGDRALFRIDLDGGAPDGWRAFLRTDLGRARVQRDELVASLAGRATFAGDSWRDIPLHRGSNGWALDLPLVETGWFRAKACLVDREGRQHWPAGGDVGLSVHPDCYRTANLAYCAFPRMFGPTKAAPATRNALVDDHLTAFDRHGFTVIPPSGTLRDLKAQIPHIADRLGCTVLHLLPLGPTPTVHARFGRYGSPYASQDLTAIDPALVEFDRRTTAVDQFRELADAAHLHGCRVVLDIVINHTGWGSTLLNSHPEWFKRDADGAFHSPGAWGNTWADLVELEHHRNPALWEEVAAALLVWCRRGVDGFRCDAGYMVPLQAWQYIIARVRQEFPEALFLLEGLGGGWDATAALLSEGGMQWAYSELFQNFSGGEVARYLDHCSANAGLGLLVHYSETHDNDRLAKRGKAWSLNRNRLCALASRNGGFAFSAGVEWLAAEKLEVHQSRGLNWGAEDNIVDELARLGRLLAHHPAFFDGAAIERLGPADEPVLALRRTAADGGDPVLVLVNTDPLQARTIQLAGNLWRALGQPRIDLLGQDPPPLKDLGDDRFELTLPAAGTCCLAATAVVADGDAYRRARAQAAWAYGCLARLVAVEHLGPCHWRALAAWVAADPVRFLAAAGHLDPEAAQTDLLAALGQAANRRDLPPVVRWGLADTTRVVPVPPGHWLLLKDSAPFAATLERPGQPPLQLRSVEVDEGHIASFPPGHESGDAVVAMQRFAAGGGRVAGAVRLLATVPDGAARNARPTVALLTNGIGGMARLGVDFGRVQSKYDCALGANLHPEAPSDRHVLVKRVRAWLNADGFITPLDGSQLERFQPGPPAQWSFTARAGDGRTVRIDLAADMLAGRNTTVLRFLRPEEPPARGRDLPDRREVRLVLRVDCEDRGFHNETQRSPAAEQWFRGCTTTTGDRPGFAFAPAGDRRLRVWSDAGRYHPGEEWSTDLPHPVEASRGMRDRGDAWSPGWFEIPLIRGKEATLVLCADAEDPPAAAVKRFIADRFRLVNAAMTRPGLANEDLFGQRLAIALQSYVVRRGAGRTVIAGYPWFLDWGRDTFICCRGLLAAGMADEVRHILLTFAGFEQGGTLPNLLNGDTATNRDTSDAPLWFALVCDEAAAALGDGLWQERARDGRTLVEVVRSIAGGYLHGTANGIRVDAASGLVWSPPHFTWMDTNYPAGTPRAGYPIEIQALWARLLRLLDRLGAPLAGDHGPWWALAERVQGQILARFWLPERGWLSDCLFAPEGTPAAAAVADTSLRPNMLLAVSLGQVGGEPARRCCAAAARWLLVPGAIRSLAPLPVSPPLAIHGADGRLLNDPERPYCGRYEGDEDTRRKPAYHNGTAWTWQLPVFCEALAAAWDRSDAAVEAARAYLGSMDRLLGEGCAGQLPEIIDGDAPHAQRGCDAQAWGVSEALRVWKQLGMPGCQD